MRAVFWFGPLDGEEQEILSLEDVLKIPFAADASEPAQLVSYIHPICAQECQPQRGIHAYCFER